MKEAFPYSRIGPKKGGKKEDNPPTLYTFGRTDYLVYRKAFASECLITLGLRRILFNAKLTIFPPRITRLISSRSGWCALWGMGRFVAGRGVRWIHWEAHAANPNVHLELFSNPQKKSFDHGRQKGVGTVAAD